MNKWFIIELEIGPKFPARRGPQILLFGSARKLCITKFLQKFNVYIGFIDDS